VAEDYIRASADIVVKYLLGVHETEKALISFINAVLEDSGFQPIYTVSVQNPFHIKNFLKDKISVLDIKAKDKTGKVFNIEIQSTGDSHFKNRSLYYWARLYSKEIKESELYKELNPVICINLLNYKLFPETEKLHTCFLLKEKDENFMLTSHQELHFIEIPKLKSLRASGQLEQWLLYLEYEGRSEMKALKIIEEVMKMNPEIESTHARYEQFTSSEEMRDLYEARVKYNRDVASLVDSGIVDTIQKTLIRLLNKKFTLSEEDEKLIFAVDNSDLLNQAVDETLFAENIEQVLIILK